jgi:hypothetical protein
LSDTPQQTGFVGFDYEKTGEGEDAVVVLGAARNVTWLDFTDGWPTISAEMLAEYVKDDQTELRARQAKILEAAARVPSVFLDEQTAKRATDYIKTINTYLKDARADHDQRKSVFLVGGGVIDNIGHDLCDTVVTVKKAVETRLGHYQRAVAEAERRRREEEARRAQEEADRLRREAEEAERRLMEAEDPDEPALAAAIAAGEAAKQAAKDVVPVQRAAEAKPAELARVRTDYGAMASFPSFWDFEGIDRATLDLEALRSHIPLDCLQTAVRSAVKAGARQIRGVARIFENTRPRVT